MIDKGMDSSNGLVEQPPPDKEKLYGWVLIIMGILLFCWTAFSIFAIANYWYLGEPQRDAVLSGKTEITNDALTQALYWFARVVWVAIGAAMIWRGRRKISGAIPVSSPTDRTG